MNRIRRVAPFRLLSLALAAGTLAACGVKGDLEAPPGAASAAPAGTVERGAVASGGKVFSEESDVRNVPHLNMNPPMPPKEWEKEGAEKSKKTQSERLRSKSLPSDRPFILDGLL